MLTINSCIEAIIDSEYLNFDSTSDKRSSLLQDLISCEDSNVSKREQCDERLLETRKDPNNESLTKSADLRISNGNTNDTWITERQNEIFDDKSGYFHSSNSRRPRLSLQVGESAFASALIPNNQSGSCIIDSSALCSKTGFGKASLVELLGIPLDLKEKDYQRPNGNSASIDVSLHDPNDFTSYICDQNNHFDQQPLIPSTNLDKMMSRHDSCDIVNYAERHDTSIQPFISERDYDSSETLRASCHLQRISSFDNNSANNSSETRFSAMQLVKDDCSFAEDSNVELEDNFIMIRETDSNGILDRFNVKPSLVGNNCDNVTDIISLQISYDTPLDLSLKHKDNSRLHAVHEYSDNYTEYQQYLTTSESNGVAVHEQNKFQYCGGGRTSNVPDQSIDWTSTLAEEEESNCWCSNSYFENKNRGYDHQQQHDFLFTMSSANRLENDQKRGTAIDTDNQNCQITVKDIEVSNHLQRLEMMQNRSDKFCKLESSKVSSWKNKVIDFTHQKLQKKMQRMPALLQIAPSNLFNSCLKENEGINRPLATKYIMESEETLPALNRVADEMKKLPEALHRPTDNNMIFACSCVESSYVDATTEATESIGSSAYFNKSTEEIDFSSQLLSSTMLPSHTVTKKSRGMTPSTNSAQESPRSIATGNSFLGNHSPSDILHLQCNECITTFDDTQSFRSHFASAHGREPIPNNLTVMTMGEGKSMLSKHRKLETAPIPLQELSNNETVSVSNQRSLWLRTRQQHPSLNQEIMNADDSDQCNIIDDNTHKNEIKISENGVETNADGQGPIRKSLTLREFLDKVMIHEINRISVSPPATVLSSGGACCLQTYFPGDNVSDETIPGPALLEEEQHINDKDVRLLACRPNFDLISNRISSKNSKVASDSDVISRKRKRDQLTFDDECIYNSTVSGFPEQHTEAHMSIQC